MRKTLGLLTAGILLALAPMAVAEEKSGYVNVPLEQYNQLVEAGKNPVKTPRPAPAGYALGEARLKVTAKKNEARFSALVDATLSVKVLDDDWVLVPILPAGTAVESATISGNKVELISTSQGLAWGAKEAGSYEINLLYNIDAVRSQSGFSLAVPLPQAAATTMDVIIPGSGLDASVIPAAGVQVGQSGEYTTVHANVPASAGVQISWRTPAGEGYSLSRAQYSGKVGEDAVTLSGDLQVDLFGDESFDLRLFPLTTTLNDIKVDGKQVPIVVKEGFFTAPVRGKGSHKVLVDFQAPIVKPDGPPKINLHIPAIPVSRIDLTLPGKKEVTVNPASNVSHRNTETDTVATVFVPMTETVELSWTEAVPEAVKAELRASAAIYHAIYAEEGVLSVHAMVTYEITRGETSQLELIIPKGVEINRITSATGGIADWKLNKGDGQKPDTASIFLDRQIKDGFQFDVFYDRPLAGANADDKVSLPLLVASAVHRQRGMVALLSSKDLTLKPVTETDVTRVGENQLPPFVRDAVKMTIAHTFKYSDTTPVLVVQTTTPERKQGKFDAAVNTLISLSDVTMKGSASTEVSVKSGAISELQLEIPKDVNVLSLTAPSLRIWKVEPAESRQTIDIQFTQDMEGQFRVEANYEFIMGDTQAETRVPTLSVKGAEVEQGRIAVEALSAVEVQPASVKSLSSLDPNELPQQLILKTTNPILLSYKYVRAEPAYELSLKITRHREVDVQSAAIDSAKYSTLYTKDGLSVTSAEFFVRNTREQFLRVKLPAGSKVWSAFVNGNAEKPALADAGEKATDSIGGPEVLIRIINSSQGFPVNLIYQTPVSRMGRLGTINGELPRPDMVVTQTRWDVYLPDSISYGQPDSNMEIKVQEESVSSQRIQEEMQRAASKNGQPVVAPLQLSVPTAGVRFSFEKLYANQAKDNAWFRVPYASGLGRVAGWLLVVLGSGALWFGIAASVLRSKEISPRLRWGSAAAGVIVLIISVSYLGVNYMPALLVSIAAIAFIAWLLSQHKRIIE